MSEFGRSTPPWIAPPTVGCVHVVVPAGVDDPARPSGGNVYDRRICRGLAGIGWSVLESAVPGSWPHPDPAACATLAGVLAAIPDGAVVLLDGLIGSAAPEVLLPQAARLRLVVLAHLPLDEAGEAAVLSAAAAVLTTSAWTRQHLADRYALPPSMIHVAEPGVDPAGLASGTPTGGQLLSVAALTPVKGHDVLLAALSTLVDLRWRCICVGSADRDPGFAARLKRQSRDGGLADRVSFVGPRTGADLAADYAAADLLVVASRAETYGMVVTEALARGLPVVATAVGGLPEALGTGIDGTAPGLLVPPDDAAALAAALRRWLRDSVVRQHLRRSARERRVTLRGWSATALQVSRVLTEAAA